MGAAWWHEPTSTRATGWWASDHRRLLARGRRRRSARGSPRSSYGRPVEPSQRGWSSPQRLAVVTSRVWLELATVEWVGRFNTVRLHSSLGDIPPIEFEAQHAAIAADRSVAAFSPTTAANGLTADRAFTLRVEFAAPPPVVSVNDLELPAGSAQAATTAVGDETPLPASSTCGSDTYSLTRTSRSITPTTTNPPNPVSVEPGPPQEDCGPSLRSIRPRDSGG
jgi:hypothetical protein